MSCIQSAAGFHPCRHRAAGVPSVGLERRLREALPVRLWNTVVRWAGRARQRRDLAELDAHLLKDIGVTAGEARREAAKPFWVE
jgi:uncharacterized protein YjiS (DUF1127 family)